MGTNAPPQRNVAIFLDMENLRGGVPGNVAGVHIGAFVRGIEQAVRAGGLGSKTALVRAYANWGRPEMQAYSHELLEHGIEPVQIFSFDKNIKNAADIELCVDVLAVAHDSPWIDMFVIASGDGGFVPLIRRLHHLNKYVIVASTNLPGAGIVNAPLKSVADEYHQIPITGPVAAVSPVSPAPATSTTAKSTTAKSPVAAKKPQPAKKQVQPLGKGEPHLKHLKMGILALLEEEPQLLIDGKVDTAALSPLLRNRWPALDVKKYGSKNLGSFVKAHCGYAAHKPQQGKKKMKLVAVP